MATEVAVSGSRSRGQSVAEIIRPSADRLCGARSDDARVSGHSTTVNDMGFDQSDDEVQAHMGGPAVQVVHAWLARVFDDEAWDEALKLVTPEAREQYALDWLEWELSPDLNDEAAADLVRALVAIDTTSPYWTLYAETMIEAHRVSWGDLPDNLATGTRPRVEALDTEIVAMVDYRKINAEPSPVAGTIGRVLASPHPPAVQFTVVLTESREALILGWQAGPDFPRAPGN